MQKERGIPGYQLAINLLYIAGFLVMLGLGFYGLMYVIGGVVIFLAGTAMTTQLNLRKHEDLLDDIVLLVLALFLANMVFYSSAEVVSVFDLSFVIYAFLLLHLVYLAFIKGKLVNPLSGFPFYKVAIFFLIAVGLSVFKADHLKDVAYFFVINLFAFLIFTTSYTLVRRGLVRQVLEIIFWFGVVSAAFAVWQLYSDNFKIYYYPFLAQRDQKILELWEVVSRVVGTWQHPSYLGIFLAITLVIGTYLLYQSKNLWKNFSLVGGMTLIGATLLLTNTRSSVLAAGLGVFLFVVFEAFRVKEANLQFRRNKWIMLGVVAGLSLLLYQFVFVAEIYTKPQAWRVDASATIWGRFLRADAMSTESLVQRSQLWSLAWEDFKTSPFIGIGAKNFPFEVEKLFETGTDAHNVILQTMAEMGLVGLAAVLFIYLALLKKSLGVFIRDFSDSDKSYQSVLLVLILILFFDSVFNNPLYSLRVLALFWLFAALLLSQEKDISAPKLYAK